MITKNNVGDGDDDNCEEDCVKMVVMMVMMVMMMMMVPKRLHKHEDLTFYVVF